MILDKFSEFADAVALDTSGTGTDIVGDVIDLGGPNTLSAGQLFLVIEVTTAFTTSASGTVQFSIASDSTATVATDGNQTIHYLSDVFAVATLVAGYQLVIPIPGPSPEYERYLAFQSVIATGAITAGSVNAFLTADAPRDRSFPDANN